MSPPVLCADQDTDRRDDLTMPTSPQPRENSLDLLVLLSTGEVLVYLRPGESTDYGLI